MTAPNVLFLAIDSLRADAAYGDHVSTPTFDRLAVKGASFHQCVSTATTTTPSFSSMLTGCYPPRHGVRGLQGYRLSPQVTTMAETFAKAGYETHAEVTGPLVPETGVLRGFDDTRHRPGYKVRPFGWRDEILKRMGTYRSPWLMLLHTWEVHRPFRPPPEFRKRWDRHGYEAMVEMSDEWLAPVLDLAGEDSLTVITGDHGEEYASTVLVQNLHRAAAKSRKVLRLGKWLPALDKKFAGIQVGHGFALWEHLVRVPLIISGAGVPHARIDQQVRHIDLLPTLADLCGVETPGSIDGRSLTPLMEGEVLADEPAYMEAVGVKLGGDRIMAVRTEDWKFMTRKDRRYLYRLDGGAPPDEKKNVVAAHPEIARRFEAIIDEINSPEAVAESGMSESEEAIVEQHLRDLGYL